MTDPNAKAREIADKVYEHRELEWWQSVVLTLRQEADAEGYRRGKSEGRREAIEEAAKWVQSHSGTCESFAKAIRDLAGTKENTNV